VGDSGDRAGELIDKADDVEVAAAGPGLADGAEAAHG
jgi:hypothetical protein